MTRIVALLAGAAGLALGTAFPVQGAGNFTTVPAKHGKCKKGWTKKTIRKQGRRVTVCVKRRAPGKTTPAPVTTTTQTTTGPTTPTNTTPTVNTNTLPAQASTTRDDAAAQNALQTAFASLGGVLPLERYTSIGSVTMSINRVWFWSDGRYKFASVDWMQQTGEKCSAVQTGTWSFKEGYRVTLQNGTTGVIARLTISLDTGQVGDDIIGAVDGDTKYVYVGSQLQQYEVNPNMLDGC